MFDVAEEKSFLQEIFLQVDEKKLSENRMKILLKFKKNIKMKIDLLKKN
jgi:hypothetical protein